MGHSGTELEDTKMWLLDFEHDNDFDSALDHSSWLGSANSRPSVFGEEISSDFTKFTCPSGGRSTKFAISSFDITTTSASSCSTKVQASSLWLRESAAK